MELDSHWSQLDQQNLWHPYTQHHHLGALPVINRAHKAIIYDTNNKTYIDAISSWWTCPFGHTHPKLIDSIVKQANQLEHVLFGGFTHTPAIELSEKLLSILPDNQKKIFFSDNGSTAVEVAIKASYQYFVNQNQPRLKILAFEDAFHGDTFGAMAASGIGLFTEPFKNQLLQVDRIPIPKNSSDVELALNLLKTKDYACFIFEPLVQGAAGMKMYDAHFLEQIIQAAKTHKTITIADEVMTGFGKTGQHFAVNYLENQPDVMCLSKALTGGMLPMAITTFSQHIYDGFLSDDVNKALMHGHTFTANPLGCAVANAAIDLLLEPETQQQIIRINQDHHEFVQTLKQIPKTQNHRLIGTIVAFDVMSEDTAYYGSLRQKMYDFFIENGVLLRPVGNTIYIMPPYVITNQELQKVYDVVLKLLETLD